ncbi:unnamed protein product [Microthlaspi erraticum]|uniref:FBD domain-containing protein n=1 Tax=Microthlaspi erraticum TaxID=1685480 RepID=A0A6D2LC65_9BRAS|nr:unnamed protein product [Microthlaspi erraticum]
MGKVRRRASWIIDNFLLQSNAPVLETLHLSLLGIYEDEPEVYENWVKAAVARHVRDLELVHLYPQPFPRILYTCQTLVALRLQQVFIVDVPSTACFRFLKDLSLLRFCFSSSETFSRFLSACPNLETLMVRRWGDNNLNTFKIDVPSLKSLRVYLHQTGLSKEKYKNYCGFVISAPSLKTLKIDANSSEICSVSNMPELVKAEINLKNGDSKLLGCLSSAKHLTLCLELNLDGYLTSDFNQLVSLELCTICSLDWICLILKHTPKLRALKLRQICYGSFRDLGNRWEKPSCVPECLISSLETVEWDGYQGKGVERHVAIYILENAKRLKTVAIIPSESIMFEEKLKMVII